MCARSTICKGRRAAGLALALCLCLLTPALADGAGESRPLLDAPASMLTETPGSAACQLGSAAADAARESTGAEISLVPSGALANDLNAGDVTYADVTRVFTRDEPLYLTKISPLQLRQLLEDAVSHIVIDPTNEKIDRAASDYDGFLQVSGFSFRYDASAPVGARVLSVRLDGGEALDLTDGTSSIAAASTEEVLAGLGGEKLDLTLADALWKSLGEHDALPVSTDKRITVLGTRDGAIVGGILPVPAVAAGALALAAALAFSGRRLRRDEEDRALHATKTIGNYYV